MFGGGIIFDALAIVVVGAALLVVARLVLCGVVAARVRRFGMAAIAVIGALGVATLFGALVVMWFIYGVAHTGKNMTTFVRMLLVTGVPYVAGLLGLWFLGGALARRLPRTSIAHDSENGAERVD
ncbi:MAG: hypothetical protein PVH25_14230 [Burkholderiales bacterium]